MSNFTMRLLTGAGLVATIISLVWVSHLGFLLLLLLINSLGLLEFYRLFQSTAVTSRRVGGMVLSTFILVVLDLVLCGYLGWKVLLAAIPMAFLLFAGELYLKATHPFHNLAFTFLGIICITLPLSFFAGIAFLPFHQGAYHAPVMLGYFFLLWASDSGAYLTGKYLGRRKLFERISPGKTWEGSMGGAISSFLVATMNAQFFKERSLTEWLVMATLIIVAGTYGDLVKSMMKRSLHIKDSGTILPGHGGILDRFDTLLGSAPFVFLYLFFR